MVGLLIVVIDRLDFFGLTIILPALLTAACSSSTETSPAPVDAGVRDAALDAGPADTGSPDTGTQVSEDAGFQDAGCPSFSQLVNGDCVTTLTWEDVITGPPARDHHVTFLQRRDDSATLYLSGGVDLARRVITNDLWYADVRNDGTVSNWTLGPTPPHPQLGAGLVVRPDRVYVVSGRTLGGSRVVDSAEVYSLSLGDDGVPGEWRAERPLPEPSFHGTAEYVDGWIFAIGGIPEGAVGTSTVWRAQVMDDGRLSSWVAARPLPEGRTHHASFVHDRSIFVVNGLDGSGNAFLSASYFDYLVATVDENGDLSPWTKVDLPFAMSTHSATLLDDRVILVGGFDEDVNIVDVVRIASIVDGRLEDFDLLTALPFARAHVHHAPRWGRWLFAAGGNIGNQVAVRRIIRGTLD